MCFIAEIVDKTKATREQMSCVDRKRSWKLMSSKEKEVLQGRKDTNNNMESLFSHVKNEKRKGGTSLSLDNAGGVSSFKTRGVCYHIFFKQDENEPGFFNTFYLEMHNIVMF